MNVIQFIIASVAFLLLAFNVYCQEGCSYQYIRQPGRPVNSCHLESPVPLELRCRVSAVAPDNDGLNFSILWHYSPFPPSEGNSTSTETILGIKSFSVNIQAKLIQNTQVSILTVTNYTETASGYYWCTVNDTQSARKTLNPSQVVNITICPFAGESPRNVAAGQGVCAMRVDLFENADNRCADHPASISITNVHFQEMCMATDDNNKSTTVTTLARTEETHTSQPLATDEYTSKQLTTTDIDGTFQNLDLSTSNQFPMHYIWMIVGIAFALLVAIIVVMLIAIVYLSHKKNKIRFSNMSRSHITNSYFENSNPDSVKEEFSMGGRVTTADQHEIGVEAGYETIPGPTNVIVIHAHNATFGADDSPGSKTSSSRSAFHSPPGEYGQLTPVKTTRDLIKVAQRHKYEMVESGEESEYSHLQHSHGGSRKFSTNSAGTAPSPSMPQSRGKVSITSSLSLSGHQPGPIFDSPEYMTVGSKSTKDWPETGEGVIHADNEYSHINPEALKSSETRSREAEGSDLDREGYHQLPSVFIGVAKQRPNDEINPEQRQNIHTTNAHPPAHRHKSATLASEPYTPIETANVKKRNTYSFAIVSTEEQYVSERGHTYHLLERSDEHQQYRSPPDSNEGSLKFHMEEDRKESSSIPPYSQVSKSDSDEQKETDKNKEQSDSSSLQESSMESSRKVIPPYSQVDKSKKKNRQPQAQLDAQLNPETHHYHQSRQT